MKKMFKFKLFNNMLFSQINQFELILREDPIIDFVRRNVPGMFLPDQTPTPLFEKHQASNEPPDGVLCRRVHGRWA